MSTLLFIFLTSNVNVGRVLSVPISSRDTSEETVHWVDGANTRGTVELFLSCVLTLLLCMWTSLHLNLPRERESALKQVTIKFLWTLLALFAPELIVFCAWEQWVSANYLSKEINKLISDKPKSDRPRHPWTMTHSFFAGMGGFAFEVDNDGNSEFIKTDLTRIPLTAQGVLLLAQCGHIPDIPEEVIIDKSKADGFAKTLVCLQAGWCLLQYIGRLASHLPVSSLEVNTLGHAICAFAIYLSWWHKPLDIKAPYVLSGDLAPPPLVAYMWMCSKISPAIRKDDRNFRREIYDLVWKGVVEGDEGKTPLGGGEVEFSPEEPLFGFSSSYDERVFTTRERKKRDWRWFFLFNTEYWEEPVSQTVQLSAVDARRWRLASSAITRYEDLQSRCSDDDRSKDELLQACVSNWPGDDLFVEDDIYVGFMLTFISTVYGGLHASAWNHFFSSWQERLLWRISSVVIAAAGALMSLAMVWFKVDDDWEEGGKLVRLFRMFGRVFHKFGRALGRAFSRFSWVLDWIVSVWNNLGDFSRYVLTEASDYLILLFLVLGFVLLCSVIAAYCFCRIFLVVEAFISLRELPAGVYITPSWSQLLPHL